MTPESPDNPTLNDALRKAAIQQASLQLDMQLQKNLAFFKEKDPGIYEQFSSYTPTALRLEYSSEGYINLVNHDLNDQPVYPSEPKRFCQEYINKYVELPSSFAIHTKRRNVIGENTNAHASKMNRLIDLIHEGDEKSTKLAPLGDHTNLLFQLGIGLGYLVPLLLEKTDLHHLIVLEPHPDSFFAALHTVDWEEIYQHFSQPNHSIKFFIGMQPHECMIKLRQYLQYIGVHNLYKPYFIDHLSSPEMKETTKSFLSQISAFISSLGYFDDEQMSLAHTVSNLENKVPILRRHPLLDNKYHDKPALLIGNGPSLDNSIDLIRKNQEHAILITCGTAIGSLKKLGIKPDFHIELERTRPTIEWVEAATDPEFRKDIIFLALNTVHPDGFKLFEKSGMAMKTNDLGTHFFSRYIPEDQQVVMLSYSNPTVINCGLAFTIGLGFKDIVLLGVDLGYPSGEQHHSKSSIHYEVDEKHEAKMNLTKHDDASNIRLPGNFGGEVISTALFEATKASLEGLLRLNPNVNCYNTGAGIYIEGAQPTPLEAVSFTPLEMSKQDFIDQLFKEHFSLEGLKDVETKQQIIDTFSYASELLKKFRTLIQAKPTSVMQAIKWLDIQHQLSLQTAFDKNTEVVYTLLKGSVASFGMALSKLLISRSSEEEALNAFYEGSQLYTEFLDHAIEKVDSHLLDNDENRQHFKEMIKTQ